MSKLYNKKTKKRYQNTKGKNKSKNKTMAQRGGFWPFTTATDSTTATDNTSSWFDVFTGKSKDVAASASNAVGSAETSLETIANSVKAKASELSTEATEKANNIKTAVVGPATPSYSATQPTTYGGKTHKHKHKCKKHHKHTATCCNHRKCRK
jgi:hypothetical protein